MTLEMWRILTVVCAALSVVFAIVAIIVYKALRIKQAKLVLSGADAASEIQKLRSSRVGTWLNPVPRGEDSNVEINWVVSDDADSGTGEMRFNDVSGDDSDDGAVPTVLTGGATAAASGAKRDKADSDRRRELAWKVAKLENEPAYSSDFDAIVRSLTQAAGGDAGDPDDGATVLAGPTSHDGRPFHGLASPEESTSHDGIGTDDADNAPTVFKAADQPSRNRCSGSGSDDLDGRVGLDDGDETRAAGSDVTDIDDAPTVLKKPTHHAAASRPSADSPVSPEPLHLTGLATNPLPARSLPDMADGAENDPMDDEPDAPTVLASQSEGSTRK